MVQLFKSLTLTTKNPKNEDVENNLIKLNEVQLSSSEEQKLEQQLSAENSRNCSHNQELLIIFIVMLFISIAFVFFDVIYRMNVK